MCTPGIKQTIKSILNNPQKKIKPFTPQYKNRSNRVNSMVRIKVKKFTSGAIQRAINKVAKKGGGEAILPPSGLIIPVWTISDCLKFLRRRKYFVIDIKILKTNTDVIIKKQGELRILSWAKTPLEACRKAVLAVLELKSGQGLD